jgi:hypothetical protein
VIQAQNFVVVGLAAIGGGQNHEEFDEGAVLCSGKESAQHPRLVWRAKLVVAAARDRAIEMAQQRAEPSMPRPPTVLQRRRLAERLGARS